MCNIFKSINILVSLILMLFLPSCSKPKPDFNKILSDNNKNVSEYFKKNPDDINMQDDFGMSPLHYAVYKRKTDIVKSLCLMKANPNLKNKCRMSPLMLAKVRGEKKIADILRNNGAVE